MDENDLFAELDALTSNPGKSDAENVGSPSGNEKNEKNLEDELFELLNGTNDISPIKSESVKPSSDIAVEKSPLDTDEDFLSWLEETPNRTSSEGKILVGNAQNTEEKPEISGTSASPTNPTSIGTKAVDTSLDNFLNSVLGTSESAASVTATDSADKNNSSKQADYEKKLEILVDSPFPDLGALRFALDQGGYVPDRLRGKILILLLTGRAQLDDEALHFSASAKEKKAFGDLLPDCEALIHQARDHEKNAAHLVESFSDVVFLYCQRRNVDYKNVYSRILLSILGANEDMPKSVLSSCFYSLAANFLPLVGLQYTSLELATDAVHFWFRLLVTYHCPALAQHLDRVLPGWEKSSKEFTTQQASKINSILKGSNKLDQLEKELGLTTEFDFDQEDLSAEKETSETSQQLTPTKTTNKVVESASPRTERLHRKGIIPTNWILSFFAGNLPASESAKLLDWSVFNGERFAGLYFLTTLFDLHSDLLLQMNGNQIITWMENIERQKEDWYKQCSFLVVNPTTKEKQEMSCKDLTWAQFTSGWIKATANLIGNTPQAFRESLPRTETWAMLAAERQSKALSNQFKDLLSKEKKKMHGDEKNAATAPGGKRALLDEQLHGAVVEDKIFDDNGSEDSASDSEGEEEEEEEEPETGESSPTTGLSPAERVGADRRRNPMSTLMGQLRAVASSFREDLTMSSVDLSMDLEDSFAQDQKLTADTICLWSSVEEVLPCICSNTTRRSMEDHSPKDVFTETIISLCEGGSLPQDHNCFFLSPVEHRSAPFYYAIDCRRMSEKTIGLFPKAYSLDPEVIYDADGLHELLTILEPIAASTHICIIGSGKEYYHWLLSLKYKRKTKKWKKELKEAMEEDSRRINALAMSLLKKSFKYISVLQGGFYEAVQYLHHKPEANLSLMTALVDIDRVRLASMLGIALENSDGSRQTLTSRLLNEAAPAALKTVGSFISNFRMATTAVTATTTGRPTVSTDPVETPLPPTMASGAVETIPPPPATSATAASETSSSTATGKGIDTAATAAAAKQMLSGFGKTLGFFGASSLDTIKKGISAVAEKASTTSSNANNNTGKDASEDRVVDDGLGPKEPVIDDQKIHVVKSDQERAQALAMHRMSGLKKGDAVTISRAELPGAILFPCTKIKEVWVEGAPSSDNGNNNDKGEGDVGEVPSESFEIGKSTSMEESDPSITTTSTADPSLPNGQPSAVKKEIVVTRYLVVSRERFMVLDANGGGVGSVATVKSNHHLTELTKMTFRKKDPELVNLHILGDDGEIKIRKYRVTKYQDFITTLQKHMERFK